MCNEAVHPNVVWCTAGVALVITRHLFLVPLVFHQMTTPVPSSARTTKYKMITICELEDERECCFSKVLEIFVVVYRLNKGRSAQLLSTMAMNLTQQ